MNITLNKLGIEITEKELQENAKELQVMSPREIAIEAQIIMNIVGYEKAKKILKYHVEICNKKMKEISDRINRELGTRRATPKIRTITDFKRFK